MSKKYRIGYLDEDEGYQAKFYQAFKNEFDIKILPIENINNVYDVLRFINDEELDALVVDYRLADSGQLTFNGDSVVDLINSQKKYFPLVMLTSYAQDAIAHMEDVYIGNAVTRLGNHIIGIPCNRVQGENSHTIMLRAKSS